MLRYAITPGQLHPHARETEFRALADRCASLALQGADFLLLREKALGPGALVHLARLVLASVRAAGATRVLVPGRADVALAAGAHGVHLPSSPGELRPDQVHQLMPQAAVSVSCHSPEDVRRAARAGADLILFAPVFRKVVDGNEVVPGVGLEALREACEAAGTTPVLALGGVTAGNAESCLQAGAAGFAAIRMFFGG